MGEVLQKEFIMTTRVKYRVSNVYRSNRCKSVINNSRTADGETFRDSYVTTRLSLFRGRECTECQTTLAVYD